MSTAITLGVVLGAAWYLARPARRNVVLLERARND
jgi:hypothetical protein